MFKTTLINQAISVAITLLAQIPWDGVVKIIRGQFERKVHPAILREIDRLVDKVDGMDLPGEEKFRWVFDSLKADDSPVKSAALNTATYLLDTAIQVSVTKLRALKG